MVFLKSLKCGHIAPFQKFIKETGAKKFHKIRIKLAVFGPTRFELKMSLTEFDPSVLRFDRLDHKINVFDCVRQKRVLIRLTRPRKVCVSINSIEAKRVRICSTQACYLLTGKWLTKFFDQIFDRVCIIYAGENLFNLDNFHHQQV